MPEFSSTCPIGLDIGRQYIKAAQMSGFGGGGALPRLAAAVCLPRANTGEQLDASDIQQIAQALRQAPFQGHSVVLAVPTSKLMTSVLELPPRASGAPIERLARVELGRRHGVDTTAMEMACWDLPSPARAANRTCVMAVGCMQQDADALAIALELQGFSIEAMDVHALAISRACAGLLGEERTGAILDVGWVSSRLALLYKGTVVYERNLPKCGTDSLKGYPASHGEATAGQDAQPSAATPIHEEALLAHFEVMASEVRIPLSYLATQYPDAAAKQLVLVGGGARTPELAEFLSQKLDVQVRCPKLSDLCVCNEWLSNLGPTMALAVGLAQYSEDEE